MANSYRLIFKFVRGNVVFYLSSSTFRNYEYDSGVVSRIHNRPCGFHFDSAFAGLSPLPPELVGSKSLKECPVQ